MLRPVPLVLVLACALAPAAEAATVNVASNQLVFSAAPGEANSLTVSTSTCGAAAPFPCFVVTDSGAPVVPADNSCARTGSPNTVQCPSTGVTSYSAALDDGDDGAALALSLAGVLDGGAGNDSLSGGAGPETLHGGDGDDTVSGNGGNDSLLGEGGSDSLQGGDGDDSLDGGSGGDSLAGGTGTDTGDWSLRTLSLNISTDGAANDGEPGEADNAGADVENIAAGAGNDTIGVRDGVTGSVACGLGTDAATVDAGDAVTDCETVDRPTPPPPPPPPPPPATPPPVLGKSFNVELVAGVVFVKLPAGAAGARSSQTRRHRLEDVENVPMGSQIDTRRGAILLKSARDRAGRLQSARFSRGLFTVRQRRQNGAYTELITAGGSFRSCRARGASASATRSKRTLFGNGRGRFRTRGRFSSATVRGTEWGVRELCEGTLTRVRRGTVLVRDFKRHRTIKLRTGKTYLARRR